jgi:cell division protein FtsB
MSRPRRPGARPGGRPGAGAAPGRGDRSAASRSAVRPEAPVRSVRATEHAELEPPPRKVSLTGRAAILAVVLVVLVVSFALPLRSWFAQRGELEALRDAIASDQQSIAELERQLERWEDPQFVEAQARERLRWVKPGDVGFIVIGDDPADPADAGVEAEAAALWWQRLWSSVEKVDQGTALDSGPAPAVGTEPAE